jgi:hypothetical protein
MLPDPARITKCAECAAYYWIAKAEQIPKPPRNWKFWKARQSICSADLTATDYLQAIEQGVATSATEERYLCVRAWWAENDQYRHLVKLGKQFHVPTFTEAMVHNLSKLSQLQDDSKPQGVLTKAEIARELGRMNQAEELLTRDLPPEYEALAIQLRQWVQARERRIQRFNSLDVDGSGIVSFAM